MYGLLGEKLGHSFSPQIHAMLGDYEYKLFEVSENEIGGFFNNRCWDAINVTIPYKKAVIPYLDYISPSADKIGSVNTIVADNKGKLHGYNTDYDGFTHLVNVSGIKISSKKCLVLGTGGASLAIKAVLKDMNASEIISISRNGKDNYNNIEKHFDAAVIVNATPVGMFPNNSVSPLSLDGFTQLEGVLDLIYNPSKTTLILDAESKGIKAASGLLMLISQAKKASELFFDRKIDDGIIDEIYKKLSFDFSNIILVGMPGCGKTTVGQSLAEKLGRDLIDTDKLVVEKYNKSIPDIFKDSGEKQFRNYEHEAAEAAGKLSGKIISTGGGIVLSEENYNPLHQNGTIVFLNRDISSLARDGRPLSQNSDLELMYEKRLPHYRRFCDIEIDGNSSIDEVSDRIIEELKK